MRNSQNLTLGKIFCLAKTWAPKNLDKTLKFFFYKNLWQNPKSKTIEIDDTRLENLPKELPKFFLGIPKC